MDFTQHWVNNRFVTKPALEKHLHRDGSKQQWWFLTMQTVRNKNNVFHSVQENLHSDPQPNEHAGIIHKDAQI